MDNASIRPKLTWYAASSACFVAFCGLWQYGFSIGSINAAYAPVTNSIRRHYEARWNSTVPDDFVNVAWIITSAAFPAGGMFGSLLVGQIVQRFGILRGILLGHIFTVFFSIIMGLSDIMGSPEVLVLSRFGIGVTSGAVGTGLCVMYVIEISPRHLRGMFGSTISTGIAIGLTMSNALGLPDVFGNENLWTLLLAFTGVPSLIFIIFSKALPESPRQLYIQDNKREKTIETLQRLNGTEKVEEVLEEMDDEKRISDSTTQLSVKELFFSKPLRASLIAGLTVAAAQQATGLQGVAFNMNAIYEKAGIPSDKVYYVSIGVSALTIVLNVLAAFLIERYGRVILLRTSYVIEGLSLILLTASIETQHMSQAMSYVGVVASIGFWTGFSIGPGPVTLVIIAEFFDQAARSSALTISIVSMWIVFIFTVVATPYMLGQMRGYTFLLYGGLAFLAALFIHFKVPETKNRPFSEIRSGFRSGEIKCHSTNEELDMKHIPMMNISI